MGLFVRVSFGFWANYREKQGKALDFYRIVRYNKGRKTERGKPPETDQPNKGKKNTMKDFINFEKAIRWDQVDKAPKEIKTIIMKMPSTDEEQ